MSPKQLSRIGTFYLEEAVLDVLLNARHERDCLGPSEISRHAGIFRDRLERAKDGVMVPADGIVWGILGKLLREGRVQRCTQIKRDGGGWELTDQEFGRRRNDES